MSFWQTSAGQQATGEVKENDFAPLAKGWYTSIFESAEVDEYQGERKIKLKARVVGEGPGKNRVLFLNLKAFEGEKVTEKQRDRAINLLVKLYQITKSKLPDGEPDDRSLSQLTDKPLDLLLDVWEVDGKDGNWLVNAEAKGTKAGGAATKPAAKSEKAKAAPTAREPGEDEPDDDIPF